MVNVVDGTLYVLDRENSIMIASTNINVYERTLYGILDIILRPRRKRCEVLIAT